MKYQIKKFYSAGHTNNFQKSKFNFFQNFSIIKKIFFITNAPAYHASAWITKLKSFIAQAIWIFLFKNQKSTFQKKLSASQKKISCSSQKAIFRSHSVGAVTMARSNTFWKSSSRLCHPPDGSTSPKYKLLCV